MSILGRVWHWITGNGHHDPVRHETEIRCRQDATIGFMRSTKDNFDRLGERFDQIREETSERAPIRPDHPFGC